MKTALIVLVLSSLMILEGCHKKPTKPVEPDKKVPPSAPSEADKKVCPTCPTCPKPPAVLKNSAGESVQIEK